MKQPQQHQQHYTLERGRGRKKVKRKGVKSTRQGEKDIFIVDCFVAVVKLVSVSDCRSAQCYVRRRCWWYLQICKTVVIPSNYLSVSTAVSMCGGRISLGHTARSTQEVFFFFCVHLPSDRLPYTVVSCVYALSAFQRNCAFTFFMKYSLPTAAIRIVGTVSEI